MILTIASKELRSLFSSPSTWIIFGGLQFIFAWFFLILLDAFLHDQAQFAQYVNSPSATAEIASKLFGVVVFMMMMLIPIFTMRLIAEEKRNQTLVMLMSAPVAIWEIIAGKFIGLLLFLSLINIICFLMLSTLMLGTHLDFGLLLSNALGIFLLTACYSALGLYISTLTSQPIVAATSTLSVLFGLWLVAIAGTGLNNIIKALSPIVHFQSFNEGLLQTQDIAYFLLFISVCLMLAIRRLHNTRIYGF